MAIQMNDDGTVSDAVTKENQKGYANYEAELAKKQSERESKDKSMGEAMMKFGMGILGRPMKEPEKKAKGGKIKSASARADGCAIRGKTRA